MAVRADDVDLVRDRSLVELCQAGDEAAFGDLYARYYQRLLRFCARRVGDMHEAEEITQEAFARAFTAMPRFAGERRFYPWLTVIAARLCIDSHRRVSRAEPTADIDPGAVDGGQQQIIDNVDFAYLSQAMQQLGPRHREVLELRETQGWSYQQIADHYSVTMGTVEALLFRARKALRREFLALAGPDARLASLPVLGVAWRIAARARMHAEALSSQLAPAAAASAMGVAAVATSLGFGGAAASAVPAVAAVTKTAPVASVASVTSAPVTTKPSVSDKTEAVSTTPPAVPQDQANVAVGFGASQGGPTPGSRSSLSAASTGIATDAIQIGHININAKR
ncbi:MAG TPA: sigma-70 family RNA polymerase sigma factor [Acidimicrobiales bacterium]|nr:sigma-70 family RNA polymerase sigma factor [Acidimicrobiales bacterium]